MAEKDLKACGRHSFDYQTDGNTGLHLLKWFDNKCVIVGSSFAGIECHNMVQRYDQAKKEKVTIDCPDRVSQYNQSMGGVDLADMLICHYRTTIITRKRWYLKLIFHCVDIAKVNAWLLYQRHCEQRRVTKKMQISLRKFTTQLPLLSLWLVKIRSSPLVAQGGVFHQPHQLEEIQLFHHQ